MFHYYENNIQSEFLGLVLIDDIVGKDAHFIVALLETTFGESDENGKSGIWPN